MSAFDDLAIIKFIRFLIKNYAGKVRTELGEYDKASKGGCGRLIAFERFFRATIAYWLLLPFVVIFALPIVVFLLIVGVFQCAIKALILIGISVKCMCSALFVFAEALIVYTVGSLIWWFFKCVRPVTLDWLWAGITVIYQGICIAIELCWSGFVWYIGFIAPCWIFGHTLEDFFNRNTGWLALFAVLVSVGIIMVYYGEPRRNSTIVVIGAILMIASIFPLIIGAALTTVDGMTMTNGICKTECYARFNDGSEYSVDPSEFPKLTDMKPHTISFYTDSEFAKHLVCAGNDPDNCTMKTFSRRIAAVI